MLRKGRKSVPEWLIAMRVSADLGANQSDIYLLACLADFVEEQLR